MKQSYHMSEKAIRMTLIIGSLVLITTVLILTIAVAADREDPLPDLTTASTTRLPVTTTPPATEAGGKPDPTPVEPVFRLTRPVSGYLLVSHDTDALVFSPTMQDYRAHVGIDIEAEEGSAVVASAAGMVSAAYADPLMGFCLEIDHGNGYVSVYRNLAEDTAAGIEVGASVRAGQLIGAVGSSALIEQADLPHLHFELMKDKSPIDPLSFLSYEERTEE